VWSEASSRIIKENFVTVAVSGHVAMNRKDSEGEFIRDTCGLKLAGAGGNIELLTATGRWLGRIHPGGEVEQTVKALQRALATFHRLPAEERRPNPAELGERGRVDPDVVALAPPHRGLILKLHYRTLTREKDGSLRHAIASDFPNERLQRPYVTHYGETFEAQPDHMWITEMEMKSLVPITAKKGDIFRVPSPIEYRLVRFHLVPDMAFGEQAAGWDPKTIRGRKLTLFVEDATSDFIRMRLAGIAMLGAEYTDSSQAALGYEPSLLGFLTYDVQKQTFIRFDVVALGEMHGKLRGSNQMFFRPGRHPLGVAFGLVTGESDAERIPPRSAVRYHTLNPRYFANSN
jgi:hypothetical protein